MIKYRTVALTYTWTCPFACGHCITESSPTAVGRMTPQQALRYLPAISRLSPAVTFTGGEPMLYGDDILKLTRRAASLGLEVRLVTGVGWATDGAKTRRSLQELAEAGLCAIGISWDAYHEEFAPQEQVLMVVQFAIEAGLRVRIRTVITADGQADQSGAIFQHMPIEFESIPLIRLGRAATLPQRCFNWYDTPPRGRCEMLFMPNLEPDGTVCACCGPGHFSRETSPLVLGNADEEPLDGLLVRAASDPYLKTIFLLGPYGLYHLLRTHPVGRERFLPRSRYTGPCELCLDISNSPEVVAAVRSRLEDADGRAMLVAAQLQEESELLPAGLRAADS